jgi:hypothetical protein
MNRSINEQIDNLEWQRRKRKRKGEERNPKLNRSFFPLPPTSFSLFFPSSLPFLYTKDKDKDRNKD